MGYNRQDTKEPKTQLLAQRDPKIRNFTKNSKNTILR